MYFSPVIYEDAYVNKDAIFFCHLYNGQFDSVPEHSLVISEMGFQKCALFSLQSVF